MDTDQAGMLVVAAKGIDMSENGQAMDAIKEVGPKEHFLGCEHTQKNFKSAFYLSKLCDNNSFEQWSEDGALDMAQRANIMYKKMLADYQLPKLDPKIDQTLLDFIEKRKSSFEDSNI